LKKPAWVVEFAITERYIRCTPLAQLHFFTSGVWLKMSRSVGCFAISVPYLIALAIGCNGGSDGAVPKQNIPVADLLSVDEFDFDAGIVNPGTRMRHAFQLRNSTDQAVTLELARPTCGCTSVTLDPQNQLMPGETATLELQVATSEKIAGYVMESVMVTASAASLAGTDKPRKQILNFRISGTIEGLRSSRYVLRPDQVQSGEAPILRVSAVTALPDQRVKLNSAISKLEGVRLFPGRATVLPPIPDRDFFVTTIEIPVEFTDRVTDSSGQFQIRGAIGDRECSLDVEAILLTH